MDKDMTFKFASVIATAREIDLGEVGEYAKERMRRELVGWYRDRPDTWLKVRIRLEDGA